MKEPPEPDGAPAERAGGNPKREPRPFRVVEDRWTTVRHVVESIAIVAAGIWAFYLFVYQEKIKPASDPASLTPTIAVRRLGRDARREVLSIDIRLQNSGKSEIDIAADAVNVWGERYGTRDAAFDERKPASREYGRHIPAQSSTVIDAFAELRAHSVRGSEAHIVIEPDATQPLSYVVIVPRGKYDMIRAQTVDVPVKMSDAQKTPVAIQRQSDGGLTVWPAPKSGASEYDVSTYFALIP